MRTAFRGPGARDGFEAGDARRSPTAATPSTRPWSGPTAAALLERLRVRAGPSASAPRRCSLRDGFVTEEFIDLARIREPHRRRRKQRLDELKAQSGAAGDEHTPAAAVFDVVSE